MSISEYNYEAYFLDYHEGRLDAAATKELMDFMTRHPELKHEFESYEPVSIQDAKENIAFENKESLKKSVAAVHATTFDEIAIQYVEGILNTALTTELLTFVKQNPKYEKELAAYEKTKLVADTSIIFENKKSLKRDLQKRPVAWYYWSAAASVVLLVAIYALFNMGSNRPAINIVSNNFVADTIHTIQPVNSNIATSHSAVVKNAIPYRNPGRILHMQNTNSTAKHALHNDSTAIIAVQHNTVAVKNDTVTDHVTNDIVSVQQKDSTAHKNAVQEQVPQYVSNNAGSLSAKNKSVFAVASNTVKSIRRFFKRNIGFNRYYNSVSDKVIAYQVILGNNRYTLPVRNNSY